MNDVAVLESRRHPEDPGLVVFGRGGSRLQLGHPARAASPPRYERRRQFPLDYQRRDKGFVRRFHRALDAASAAGLVPPQVYRAMLALASFGNADGTSLFPRHSTLARRVYGEDRYQDDDPRAGSRTAATWLHQAEELGWVTWMHTPLKRRGDGAVIGQPNQYRLEIPDQWREGQEAWEDERRAESARSRRRGGRTTPKRTPAGGVEPPNYELIEERRRKAEASAEELAAAVQSVDVGQALAEARASLRRGRRGEGEPDMVERPPP